MQRLALPALLAAIAVAGCASKAQQKPPPPLAHQVATFRDPTGDAVDADGNPRRGRPDADIRRVTVDRNGDRVRFTVVAGGTPRNALRYEIFAQAAQVSGYDVVTVTRRGDSASGYVAFENSVARQTLAPAGFAAKGASLAFDVPIDPILGSTPFGWRLTLSTASGPQILDYLPSPQGTVSFPPGG
jgi:hypothetical protein